MVVQFHGEEKVGCSVHTKLLIGADGVFSKVWQQCLDDGKPKASGNVIWRARVPKEELGVSWRMASSSACIQAIRDSRQYGS